LPAQIGSYAGHAAHDFQESPIDQKESDTFFGTMRATGSRKSYQSGNERTRSTARIEVWYLCRVTSQTITLKERVGPLNLGEVITAGRIIIRPFLFLGTMSWLDKKTRGQSDE